jgi:hypothetical protein
MAGEGISQILEHMDCLCMTDDKSTTKIGVNKATLFEDASV